MNDLQNFKQRLEAAGISFSCEEPLASHTSFRIGGPAAVFCRPRNGEQLAACVSLARELGERYYLLGKGSNVLFRDRGFDGAVICTIGQQEEIRVEGQRITAPAGASLAQVCRAALDHELTGLEFAYGIPGSLGGAAYMNAGAYGGEMKDVIRSVTCLDGEGRVRTLPLEELELGYRTSIFERTGWCVLSVELELEPGDPVQIRARMDDLMERRRTKQPLELPSAGSTFKRPVGAFAGELIQRSGLRGARVGDAAVSEKHCGFVVNLGHASCQDVLELAQLVCDTVKEKTGFTLEKEIRVIE